MEKLHIPQNLHKQYILGKYCDLQIQVESSYFRAHSCVVAASSWVLEAILQSSTAEDSNLSKLSIELHGVTADAISSLLNFIYTGEFPPETYSDVEKRKDVLHAAKLYKMEEVPMEFETSSSIENGAMTNMEMLESGNLNYDLLEELVPSQNEEEATDAGADSENAIVTTEQSDGEINPAVSESEKLTDADTIKEYVSKNVNYAISHGILYCVLCSEIFPNQEDLILHMNKHKSSYRKRPERAAASLISFAFDNDGSVGEFGNYYDDDIDYHSSKKKRRPKRAFTCAECGASYSGKVYLIKHYNARHPGSLYCKYCVERFQTEELLQIHMLTHGPDIEEQCQSSTSGTKSSGSTNTKVKGKKGYTCNLCSTSFLKRKELCQHQQILHGIIKPMHLCTTCGKEFKEKTSLRAHTRVHTGEKPYMCSFCGNSFADSKTWKDHERRHRGEKPFLCTACGKSFTYRQSFTRHMKFHEGTRPFQCSFCGKAFVLRQNLKEHEKRHTK